MRYVLTLLAVALAVSGCASIFGKPNVVTVNQHGNTKVVYRADDKTRFRNLYAGKKIYPLTCEADCYAPRRELECESDNEDCHYIGKQTLPTLSAGFTVTWLGHASFHVETDEGARFLFDPVSDQFDWPVNWAFYLSEGFNRQPPNWPDDEKMSEIDAVMYSHIHYDHFNKSDIKDLGPAPQYLTPLNTAHHFPEEGLSIEEMAWYATTEIKNTRIHFVPAHHFSSRIWVPFIYDDNEKSLWGGWILENKGKTLFFAGDTGYSQHFKDIQAKYGNIDICLLPIASYFHEEYGEWYRYVHTTPEDTLMAAKELQCGVVIPWGFGKHSWKMGDISSHSALTRLLNMYEKIDTPPPLFILNEGDSVRF
ncbi:MBL fold metallo-hydrolase [Aestuariibacter sp. AA17]|uniref:MBL fold metallo-hydrolase n=1 Tax=Fluctibacter corallii TaxID=2984329 RepID=A0ABT3AA20_9ALTE|nr:MBL fold metallo-hydrolase [Aestuariibacter sp. AA17]MCV2885127.1 MBL fold metallo-hydrolase [Aestuariibacter sp. AA17]